MQGPCISTTQIRSCCARHIWMTFGVHHFSFIWHARRRMQGAERQKMRCDCCWSDFSYDAYFYEYEEADVSTAICKRRRQRRRIGGNMHIQHRFWMVKAVCRPAQNYYLRWKCFFFLVFFFGWNVLKIHDNTCSHCFVFHIHMCTLHIRYIFMWNGNLFSVKNKRVCVYNEQRVPYSIHMCACCVVIVENLCITHCIRWCATRKTRPERGTSVSLHTSWILKMWIFFLALLSCHLGAERLCEFHAIFMMNDFLFLFVTTFLCLIFIHMQRSRIGTILRYFLIKLMIECKKLAKQRLIWSTIWSNLFVQSIQFKWLNANSKMPDIRHRLHVPSFGCTQKKGKQMLVGITL